MPFAHPDRIDLTLRLLLAAFLGGFIGYERELTRQAAGLRTHILVCVGSALFMLVSLHLGDLPGTDSSRIAAQIVTGIGFLGAGTILHDNTYGIRGLTTAADLWAMAGVGMACGAAYYTAAIVTTVIMLVTLTFLRRFELKKNHQHP